MRLSRYPEEVSRSRRYQSPTAEREPHGPRSPVLVHGTRRHSPPTIIPGGTHPGSRSPTLVHRSSHRPSHRPSQPITIRVGRSRSRSPSDQSPLPPVLHRSPRSISPEESQRAVHRIRRSRSSPSPLPVRSPSRLSQRRTAGPPTVISVSEQVEHVRHPSASVPRHRRTASEG